MAAGRRRGRAARARRTSLGVADYHASAATLRARAERRARLARARQARRHALRGAHHQAPRRLRAVADARRRASRSRTRSTTATWCASSSTRRARTGCASASTSRCCDWHHPDYPAFRDEHRPYRFGAQAAPDARAVGALPRVPVRADARAADATTARSTCSGSTAAGSARPHEWRADGVRRADPRAPAGDPDQRSPARPGRLRHARAVHPAACRPRGAGRPA